MVVNRGGTDYKALISDLLTEAGDVGSGDITIEAGDGLTSSGDAVHNANQDAATTQTLSVKTGGGLEINADGEIVVKPGAGIEIDVDGNVIIDPSIERIQADWAEEDTSEPAYIKNKPCVYECDNYIQNLDELP